MPMLPAPRWSGKSLAYRLEIETSALWGDHIHAVARDGVWCVTYQPIGFLWTKVG